MNGFHVYSPPNELTVSVPGSGFAYYTKMYSFKYYRHELSFAVRLGPNFGLGTNTYMVLADVRTTGQSCSGGHNVGEAQAVLVPGTSNPQIRVDYWDANCGQQSLSNSSISKGAWHVFDMSEAGGSTGTVDYSLDGRMSGSAGSANIPNLRVTRFNIGAVSLGGAPPGTSTGVSQLHFGDLRAGGVHVG